MEGTLLHHYGSDRDAGVPERGAVSRAATARARGREPFVLASGADRPSPSCTRAELDREWGESLRKLERVLGEPVTTASIPAGYYSRGIAAAAARAGVRVLFTSEPVRSRRVVEGCTKVAGRFFSSSARGFGKVGQRRWWRRAMFGRSCNSIFWNAKKFLKMLVGAGQEAVAAAEYFSGAGSFTREHFAINFAQDARTRPGEYRCYRAVGVGAEMLGQVVIG